MAETKTREAPKGTIPALSPAGDPIFIRPQRDPKKTYFRVKHGLWGPAVVEAKTLEEAIQKYAEKMAPGEAKNKDWVKALQPLCRVSELPKPEEPK